MILFLLQTVGLDISAVPLQVKQRLDLWKLLYGLRKSMVVRIIVSFQEVSVIKRRSSKNTS